MTVYQYSKYAYTTGSWTNLPASNLVDGKSASKTYKKGGSPAPVYFDVGYDIGVGNKVDNASFCISIPQRDGLSAPEVKFYDGTKHGRNVYKYPSYVFKTMSAPTKHGNSPAYPKEELREKGGFEGSTIWYKYYYNCKGITRNQLKNLIVRVDFKTASSAGKARIGWARMEIKYSKDTSYTLDIYSDDSDIINEVVLGQDYYHQVKLHNNSSKQQTAYYNCITSGNISFIGAGQSGEIVKSGKYKGTRARYVPANNATDGTGRKGEHVCTLKFTPKAIGTYTITDKLYNKNDKGDTKSYNWKLRCVAPEAVEAPEEPIPEQQWQLWKNDEIHIIPEFLYINTDNQYITLRISGSTNALESDDPNDDVFAYQWNGNANCDGALNTMLNMVKDKCSVVNGNKIGDNEWTATNCTVDFGDNQMIFITPQSPDNAPVSFYAEMRIAVNPVDYNTYDNVTIDNLDGFYYERNFYKHSLYDELKVGYYYEGSFYSDAEHQHPIDSITNFYYYDVENGSGYQFKNNQFNPIVLADSTVCTDIFTPEADGIYLDTLNKKKYRYYNDVYIKVCSEETNNIGEAVVDIFGEKSFLYSINDSIETKYKTYCNSTLSTSISGINTIKCKSSRNCFFEEMDTDYTIAIESPQAYIGVLPIKRPHQADNKASTKNKLIKNSYLNRKYSGKTGEIDEEIGMELFLTPGEVATLQGLAKLDKPVPINLVPHMKDGDPLNHRGWAELYEVDNIEKINSFTYKCEPVVDYLTHDLNSTFEIIKEDDLINHFKVPYYLTETQAFTDKLSNIMNVEGSGYRDMQDDYGYIGNYDLNPRNQIMFTTNRPIANNSDVEIKWRDIIEVFTSRDLDNNFNVRVQLIQDDSGEIDNNVYFEYLYTNFKHYNATNGYTMNKFGEVYANYLENGIIQTFQKYTDLSLLNNDLTPLSSSNKEYTKMWLNSSSIISEEDKYIDIILSTAGGMLIMGELVTITIENDFGYYDKKVYMSDMYGRLRIPTNLPDSDYDITCEMPETKLYRPNTYKTEVTIEKELEGVVINYLDDYTTVASNDKITLSVVDRHGNPLINKNIIVDIRDMSDTHYGACINYVTDENGKIYPIIKTTGGSKILRARFIGDDTYTSDVLTQVIYVDDNYKRTVKFEMDDLYENEVVDQFGKEYVVRLVTDDASNTPIVGQTVEFILYNNEEYIERQAITNDAGFASIPLYITNGAWEIDAYYAGKKVYDEVGNINVIYNPAIKKGTISALINEKKKTTFTDIKNNVIENENDDLFSVTLIDADNVTLKNRPIRFTVKDKVNNTETIIYDGIVITDADGIAELPLYTVTPNAEVTIKYDGDNDYEGVEYSTNIAYRYADTDDYKETVFKEVNGDLILYYKTLDNSDNVVELPLRNLNKKITMTIGKYINDDLIFNSNDNYVIEKEFNLNTDGNGVVSTIPPLPYYTNGENNESKYKFNVSYCGDSNLLYKPCSYNFVKEHADNVTRNASIKPICIINENGQDITLPIENSIIINNKEYITIDQLANSDDYHNKIFKMKFKVYETIGGIDYPITNAYIKSESSCVSAGYTDENGIIELEILHSDNTSTFSADILIDVGILYNNKTVEFNFKNTISTNKTTITTVNYPDNDDATYSDLCYQELIVNTTNTNANDDTSQINNYYKVKLVNRNLNDVVELDYMGVNKFNTNKVNFYLDKGRWDMYLYAYNVDGYADGYIFKSLNITNESDNTHTIQELIEIASSTIENSIVDDFENEKMFGSLLRLQLRDNNLTVYDFGYTDNDDSNNVKIKCEDIPLYKGEYYLRIIFEYYNTNDLKASNSIDKNSIEGYLQLRLVEDLVTNELAQSYNNIIVSPVPLPDDKCLFTRNTEDGRLYFYNYDKIKNKRYIGSPYNQYKGGTNLMNELGADIFELDTGSNPLYISNGICKISIHRLSGYIELFVRDNENQWLLVNVLKVRSDYTMSRDVYSDDCISITYSGVTFTMWRGKPYIEIKHNGRDIEILDYKDRVYCELEKNGFNFRLIEESDVGRGTFDINTSTQKFDKALQVGQNIALDNFDLYDVSD